MIISTLFIVCFQRLTDRVWISMSSDLKDTYIYIDSNGKEYPCFIHKPLKYTKGEFYRIYKIKDKIIFNRPIDYGTDFEHISAEISPTYNKGSDMFGMHPTYRINKQGKIIWSNMEAEYIYIIPEKRWIEYHKRIGNKYLDNCIYIKLWKYRLTTDNTPYTFVVGKDFKFLYEYDYNGEFAWDKFDYSKLKYQNNKLYYKNKELLYEEKTNQLKLKED